MNVQNGTSEHASIEHRFDDLKESLKKIVQRFDTTPEGYLGKARAQIMAHPIAAIGIAFGLGYIVVRLARRR